MKSLKNLLVPAFIGGLGAATLHAQTLYGIGDLSGGATWSQVRAATKTGGVIYAVGSSSANGVTQGDTAIIWNSSTNTITAIPNLVTNNTGTTFITASDITPDAAYIASRSRNVASGGGRQAVLVTTSGLVSTDLGNPAGFSTPSSALSISDSGSVLYGVSLNSGSQQQATRFVPNVSAVAIPFLNVGDTTSSVTARAVSADGNFMLGTSGTNVAGGPGNHAFIYNHSNTSVNALPELTGGTWSQGLAMNSAGTLALLGGDTATNANGVMYLTDGSTVTVLGTPNASLGLNIFGGMTADGSVVGMTWTGTTNQSFLYNPNGWLDFYTVAAGSGMNLTGWTSFGINGISEDGTLVWGDGIHNGINEGYVMEFAPGYLLAAVPEPSTYAAILGLGAFCLAMWRRRTGGT